MKMMENKAGKCIMQLLLCRVRVGNEESLACPWSAARRLLPPATQSLSESYYPFRVPHLIREGS